MAISPDFNAQLSHAWQRLRGVVHSLEGNIINRAKTDAGREWLRYSLRVFLLMFGVTIVIGAMDIILMPWYVGRDQVTRMPNIQGMSYNQAAKILEESGFSVKVASEYFNNTIPAGHIVSQMPYPMSTVKSSRTVYLTLSRGKQLLEMPNLVGLSVRDARIALIRLGLSLNNATYEFNDAVAANIIFQQTVKTKERVGFGANVDVRVSLGPETVYAMVPDVEGKALEDARNIISGAGFVVGTINTASDETFVSNTVLKQIPAPNDSVKAGTPINLTIAR
jgi:eukaryotic-like serine/threonine-protein kinase